MFPSLKNPEHVSARLKNVAHEVYICVKTDEAGKNTLSTKTRNLDLDSDPELEFSLYYYTSAEANETKMVIPVHEATKTCLSMSADRKLEISSLKTGSLDSNEVDSLEDPTKFTQADQRFFYYKASGSDFALEAMNGTDSNFYLTVTDDNMLDIKENAGSDYPEDILFSLDQTG